MAKCVLCKNKKGTRHCKSEDASVCHLCCRRHRQEERCRACVHYEEVKAVRHDYGGVPRFSPEEMQADWDLQGISNSIEATLCSWDQSSRGALKDDSALKVLERLLDLYYFKETPEITEELIRTGYQRVLDVIQNDLSEVPGKTIIRILAVIYFVARRRAKGGRDYFDLIHKYVGLRAGPGMRILNMQ
jgi:hypothetical protein